MTIEAIIINACITVFSLGLLIVSIFSYRKYRNVKLLFVVGVFILFFIKGLLFSLSFFIEPLEAFNLPPALGLLDLLMLLLLFMATLKS